VEAQRGKHSQVDFSGKIRAVLCPVCGGAEIATGEYAADATEA
jgi:hypothetical protein